MKYKGFQDSIVLPPLEKERKNLSSAGKIRTLVNRKAEGKSRLSRLEADFSKVSEDLEEVKKLISEDLGSLGECPVCKTPHGGTHG